MKNQPKRTTFTLLIEFVNELGGEPMKQTFLRDLGAYLKQKERPMTEEEYQFGLEKIREELPAFKRYLLQTRYEDLSDGCGFVYSAVRQTSK
jgi:hypothetical protein